MGLTDRNRLGGIKRQQERLQRKLNKQKLRKERQRERLQERLQRRIEQQTREYQLKAASEPTLDTSAAEQAWQKYLYAKEIYKETKEIEHWRYAQECLSEYEDTLLPK
jgi:flagellar biosynthesis GTPase FlhF